MADQPVSPIKQESATTREEMDFDEPEQETGTVSPLGHETPTKKPDAPRKSVSFQEPEQEAPPSMPPRPMSPQEQAANTLIEAFPSIDTKVVKAVLAASGGKVEPAFNALLGMSDPDFQPEETAPQQPPRPQQRAPQTQMEADELYARQLADQYNSGYGRSQTRYNQREPAMRGPNRQRQDSEESHNSMDRNFFDDDLPEIGRNIQQGFMETQKRVNSWITNFKKRIDGEDEDEDLYSSGSRSNSQQFQGRQNFGPSQGEQMYGIRRQAEAQAQRRSTEANRYDADPHEFDADEFERLELRDDEAPPPMPPRTSSRKSANPDLFKPQPKPPQSGPVDEVDAAERRVSAGKEEGDKSKKWQPLTSVQPQPEEDNDPFSLGDDDEEGKEKGEDLRKDDTERLKEKARTSVQMNAPPTLSPQESATSGTKDKEMEKLMEGAEGGKKE